MSTNIEKGSPLIFRHFAFPLEAFKYFKTVQREYEALYREKLTNNQTLMMILEEHRQLMDERANG